MDVCDNPDPSQIKAGPAMKQYRKSDAYTWCLVDNTTANRENNTYSERPLPVYEVPNASEIDSPAHRDIPSKCIFVIPYDRPQTILVATRTGYFGNASVKRCKTQKNGSTLPLEKRKPFKFDRIFHTFITGALPVIAAGECDFLDEKKVKINNSSGHYIPSNNTLEYAKCLFTKKGYTVFASPVSPKKNENVPFYQDSKPLSYWLETPQEKWYTAMQPVASALGAGAGVTGGKRKTRKGKTRKGKTSRVMRRKNI